MDETEATPRPLKLEQVNATLYELRDDGLNRFSFNVQGNNRSLGPGEDEQIAGQIRLAVNNHEALVEALTKIAAFNDEDASCYLHRSGSYAQFDEPGSVEIAQNALAQLKEVNSNESRESEATTLGRNNETNSRYRG